MSAAVGAALKKILAAILTEPKVLKKVLFAILVVVVAMMMPTVFVLSLFSGNFQVDTAALQGYVEENLSDADVQLLTAVEDTMTAIEEAMIEAEMGSEANTLEEACYSGRMLGAALAALMDEYTEKENENI
jgi:hypothetical protein